MLRSFRVANHKSIRDEQELMLMPAYDKLRSAVPVAGIFGANASGKSNLLDALSWMQSAVRNSFGSWEPGARVPRDPFLLAQDAISKPSGYAVDLIVDGVPYAYGFGVDDEEVLEEWLYAFPQRRKRVVFERAAEGWTFGSTVSQVRYESVRELTRPNALFLSVAASASLAEVRPIFSWFQRLEFVAPSRSLDLKMVAEFVLRSPEHRRKVVELLAAADLGIADIEVNTKEDPEGVGQAEQHYFSTGSGKTMALAEMIGRIERSRHPVVFLHGRDRVLMTVNQESSGTRAWLALLIPALEVLENGGVLCVDEVDASLHPRLTVRLIELFRNDRSNPKQAQLIFTSHDASLLGTSFGEEILARDQVWFTEKHEDGNTDLYALSDFHPRKEENRERRYLGGSYGAVPAVFSETLVDRLAGITRESENAS